MKRVLSIIVAVASLLMMVPSSYAVEDVDRKITITNDDPHNLEYIYTENSEVYLVREHVNDDFTEVESRIYRFDNETTDYSLVTEIKTNINVNREKHTVEISSCRNGITTIQSIDWPTPSKTEGTVSPYTSGASGGTWKWVHSDEGYADFAYMTVSIITATLLSAIGAAVGYAITGLEGAVVGGALGGGINQFAQILIERNIEVLYYSYENYYYYPPNSFRPWDERYDFTYYSDKNMREQIATSSHEFEINYT